LPPSAKLFFFFPGDDRCTACDLPLPSAFSFRSCSRFSVQFFFFYSSSRSLLSFFSLTRTTPLVPLISIVYFLPPLFFFFLTIILGIFSEYCVLPTHSRDRSFISIALFFFLPPCPPGISRPYPISVSSAVFEILSGCKCPFTSPSPRPDSLGFSFQRHIQLPALDRTGCLFFFLPPFFFLFRVQYPGSPPSQPLDVRCAGDAPHWTDGSFLPPAPCFWCSRSFFFFFFFFFFFCVFPPFRFISR